jgi:N-acetylglutamate synthase-like GNAT family acetyltransferase
MKEEITIRPAAESDIEHIIDLLKSSLGEGLIPRVEEYWRWKHQYNPFGISPTLLAEHEGKVVGLRTFMRWTWVRNGNPVPAVRAVDTATHPQWQGKGIFKRLTLNLLERMREEGVEFVFNTPNEFSMPGYLKMGWKKVGRPTIWIRPNLSRTARTWLSKSSNGKEFAGEFECYSAEEVLSSPEVELLLQSRKSEGRLSTALSPKYLMWRYVEVPMFQYHATARWNGSASALVVFRLHSRGRLRELRICEILAAPSATHDASDLITELVRRFKPDLASAMAARRTTEHKVVVRAGFLPVVRSGPTLTVRALDAAFNAADDRLRWSGWRTSIGDLELF